MAFMWSLVTEKEEIKIDKHLGISVGDFVQLRSPAKRGYVRYIGKPTSTDLQTRCYWYGIELQGRWKGTGKCDGRHKGQRYFECAKKCGQFVKRDKIVKVIKRFAQLQFIENLSQREKVEMIFSADYTGVSAGISALKRFLVDLEDKERKKKKKKQRRTRLNPGPMTPDSPRKKRSKRGRGGRTRGGTTRGGKSKKALAETKGRKTKGKTKKGKATPQPPDNGSEEMSDAEYADATKGPDIETNGTSMNDSESPRRRRTWVGRNSTVNLISMFESAEGEEWAQTWADDSIKKEMDDDPVLWCLSKEARSMLTNPMEVAKMLHDIERCITLIDNHIPEITKIMESHTGEKVHMTNVIQELLKRAQAEQMSHKIINDFSTCKDLTLEANAFYSIEDIHSMVELISWIRNNITASAVTDENDAKMASLGAKEVKQSLLDVLNRHHIQVADQTRSFKEKQERVGIEALFA